MDDGSPAKKKSRFFSQEATLTKSDPKLSNQPHRKTAAKQTPKKIQIHPGYTTQSRLLPQSKRANKHVEEADEPPQRKSQSSSVTPHVFGSGQRLLTQHNADERPVKSPTTPSSTATAFQKLSVRDRRRDGIYGAQPVLQHTALPFEGSSVPNVGTDLHSANIQHTLQTVEQPQSPMLGSALSTPLAPQHVPQASHIPMNSGISASNPIDPSEPNAFAPYGHQPILGSILDGQQAPITTQQNTEALNVLLGHTHVPTQLTPHVANDPVRHQHFLPRPAPRLVDLDRDTTGRRLHSIQLRLPPIANLPNSGISNLPLHALEHPSRRHRSETPANLYTSPQRLTRAHEVARMELKRKRQCPILPPPAYIYTRTNAPDFNIFQGILLYPELVFAFATHLPVDTLVTLYSLSRDFHTIIDTRFTTVMLSQSLRKAPESSRAFPFRCYAHLCRSDPAARIAHPDPELASKGIVRRIPSFRWLRMVLHREKTVHEIMTLFAEAGIPLPSRCSLALKRIWYILDIPDNARRIGFIHNRRFFSDLDLYFAMCVFVKMDMRFNDPVAPEKRDGLKKMLLSQRSLLTWKRVLAGEIWTNKKEVFREWVKWKYELRDADEQDLETVFGVPKTQIGKLKMEYWGLRNTDANGKPLHYLLRPDQLVMREAIKRGLRFTKHFLRCLLYGYVRPDTLENYEPRDRGRRIKFLEYEGEYGVDDLVGGVGALDVEDGGDELLDLGKPIQGSIFTIKKEGVSQVEREKRESLDAFIGECMQWSEAERQAE